ncbi:hypothetical protein CTI12_AA236910 [Artemisia annua]|uniref:Defensin-like protein n=1 Tax=Artemisia annua TaxID=35608 RepID=A0A2U1N6U6_ARTAN|nr:hypothetical protein CTI12_AA236910 [Artemisia annua]
MATTATRMQLTILLVLLACFLVLASKEKMALSLAESEMISKAKSCKTTFGLCTQDCLTGCCNEKCSKKFKHGTGKCLEPMMPVAPCLCQYTC